MSTVTRSLVRFCRSAHDQVWSSPVSVVIVNVQRSGVRRGVGPADSTGKSWVRY
jgi:hypothetical protein